MWILLFAAAVCCAVGLVEMMGAALELLTCPGDWVKSYRVLPVCRWEENLEPKLRWAENRMRWRGGDRGSVLILLDMGADEESIHICRAFMRTRDWVLLCTPQELEEVLEGEEVCKRTNVIL